MCHVNGVHSAYIKHKPLFIVYDANWYDELQNDFLMELYL